ncbi:MAG TPA: DUF4105 domain-containing protein, partial [Polyangiaceae bacterium]
MKIWIATAALALLSLLPHTAHAQDRAPDRVAVLTMGPGDHPFARFGHNAILLEWRRERLALVYNYGTFAFDGLDGIRDFMAGRFRYWLSISTLSRTLRAYAAQNRTVVAQELALTEDERLRLARALELNALPENREYDYDYYYDNCSTRVRDAVDRILGGAIKRQIQDPGRLTFREHTLRLTADGFWVYFGLDLALGPLTDRPTTRWDETFIPQELQQSLTGVKLLRDGKETPLVSREVTLVSADRLPERREPPNRVAGFALAGIALGGVLAALGRAGAKRAGARAAYALSSGLLGLVLGLLGCVFFFFWAFTKHWSAFRNFNLLLFTPWALVLASTAVGVLRAQPRALRLSHWIITASAGTALLALVSALIPGFGQD